MVKPHQAGAAKALLNGNSEKPTFRKSFRLWILWEIQLVQDAKLHHFLSFFFQLHSEACGILVLRPGMEPRPLHSEKLSTNHWTAGEFLQVPFQCYLLREAREIFLMEPVLI